jgi:hypothetical protein
VPEPRVGIVILNWKRPDDTLACLTSLDTLDYPDFEVAVVDNGSDPRGRQRIRDAFPCVHLLVNERNLGFAAGCNVGIDYLLDRGAEYILLLNDDTEVASNMVSQLVAVGERQADIGMLGPTIYYYGGQGNLIWSAGGTVDAYGETGHRRLNECDAPTDRYLDCEDVDYVTGCAILVKRDLIRTIGRLDARFFAYFEETEWCARARRAGFRVVYVPAARMWHKLEPSDRPNSRLYVYLNTRNRLLYLWCTRANPLVILGAWLDLLRTALSPFVRSSRRHRRRYAGVMVTAMAHFALGRFGPPPVWI